MYLMLVLLLTPFLTACNKSEAYNYETKRVKTVNPSEKSTEESFVYSGNLEGKKETVLAMKSPGRIKTVNVDIGDSVDNDQLLATLEGGENLENRNTASKAYQNSIANLANTESLMMQKIYDAEANLRIAEENLLAALTTDKNDEIVSGEKIKDANLQLEMSKLAYQNLVNTFKQKEKDILEGISSAITSASILSSDVVSYLYNINNSTLPDEGNDFKVSFDFMVKTLKYKDDAAFAIMRAKNSSKILNDFYKQNGGILKNDDVKLFEGRDLAEASLVDAKNALRAMNDVVSDSVTHTGMSQLALDSFRSSLVNYSYSIENMLLSQDSGVAVGLVGARQALENLEVEKNNMLAQSKKQIELSEQKIELLNSTVDMSQDDINARVEILKAQVEQAKLGVEVAKKYSGSQVQMAKTQSDLAKGSLGLANVGVGNTQIKAPFDGVVVEKYQEEGTIVDAGTPILKVADISALKLVIYVPENQIKYFKNGLEAVATVDNFSDEEFNAIVERISPKIDEGSKKVRVEFSLSDPRFLKLGMTMTVSVKNDVQDLVDEKILTIPFESVQEDSEGKFVWLVVDSSVKKGEVEIGRILGNDVEVLSGLTFGDSVVFEGFDGIKEEDFVEVINE